MSEDIKALREELAKLRERVAVLEAAAAPRPASALDWGQPFMVGTPSLPRLAPMESMAPGTIICNSRTDHG